MPQPFNNAIMTNGGARLLTKAQAGEIKIEFTRVEVGNGNYTEDEKTLEALQSQTALKSMKNSYPISDIEVYNDYSVKVTALISNQDSVTGDALITAGYYINEMGLYAKEKDGTDDTEVLYSIAVTAGDNGDFMPPYNGYNPAQIIQDYFATVNNSAEITIQTSGAVALAEDLFEVRKDIELLKRNGAANGYSTETEYHAGEYCIYNNTLYRCLKDTSGEWDPESWEMTNPMEEIGQLKKSIDSLIGLFGRDEEGNMKSLGEAAFAGISHNFLTEEDAGMVAGADLLKLLKEQVDSQNSASLPENLSNRAYVYVLKISETSFRDASGISKSPEDDLISALEKLSSTIGSLNTGIQYVLAAGYFVILYKYDNINYGGIISSIYMDWTDNTNYGWQLPTFFSYTLNHKRYSLFIPERIK